MKTRTPISSHGLALTVALCALTGIAALGCNTVRETGRPIETGGQGTRNAAVSVEKEAKYSGSHTITASAKRGGSISPAGSTSVPRGSSQTFIATADAGYRVADVRVDGRSVGALADLFHDDSSSYTFENVAENHVISATFDLDKKRFSNGRGRLIGMDTVSSLVP
jgi:predicted small secreted protein